MSAALFASRSRLETIASLDTGDLPEARRFRAFQDFVAPYFCPDFATDDGDAYSCSIRIGQIGGLSAFEVETGALNADIKTKRLREIDERISIQICNRGGIGIAQNGPASFAGPLDAVVSCNYVPGSSRYDRGTRATTIFIERDRVAAGFSHGFVVPMAAPALKLLQGWLGAGRDAAADADHELGSLYSRVVVDLISHMLGAAGSERERIERSSLKTARLNSILSLIEREATSPAFGVRQIAVRLGISPRYARKLLEETGKTLSQRVNEVRLQRAFLLLVDPAHHRMTIGEIALLAGFSDISYFNRSFRKRFMMTPRDVRQSATAPGS